MTTRRLPAPLRMPASPVIVPSDPSEPVLLTVASAQRRRISELLDEVAAGELRCDGWRVRYEQECAEHERTRAALRGAQAMIATQRALDRLARATTSMDAGQLGDHLAAQVRAFPVARPARVIRAYGGEYPPLSGT